MYQLQAWLAKKLPRGLLEFIIGVFMVRLGFILFPLRKRKVLSNYRRILTQDGKEPSREELRTVFRKSIPHYTRVIISMLGRPEDVEFARDHMGLEFLPLLEQARKEGRGAILVFSNFGLFGHLFAALFLRRLPMRIPVLSRKMYAHLPPEAAACFLDIERASRECLKALRRNEIVVIPTMMNFMSKRVAVNFFGAPARLSYAPAKLAAVSGAPILPVFAIDEDNRCREQGAQPLSRRLAHMPARCRVVCDGLIRYVPGPDALLKTTQMVTRCQEKYIRLYPEQWEAYTDVWNLRGMDFNYRLTRWLMRWF